ncbi:MAG: carbohydrate binding family 9 domain-containing protein, partial [Gemmatimonadota bacterium]
MTRWIGSRAWVPGVAPGRGARERTARTNRGRRVPRTVRRVAVLGLLLPGVASGQGSPTGPAAAGRVQGPGTTAARVASPGTRLEVPVGRAVRGVEVDAALDEMDWLQAGSVDLAWEVAPGDNAPAPVETVCRITHDRDNLYLGCHALDPEPGAIRAYITGRDDIDGHDRVILTLDPYNDGRRAFEFGISALGVQWDAVYSAQGSGPSGGSGPTGPSDPSWDAIWSSSGRITDDGYVVEAAIPFESLRFPDVEGPQTWGFYVSRRWPRGEQVDVRSMVWDRDDACLLCQANLLTGLEDVEPGGAVRLTPTVTGSRTDARADFPEGRMAAGSVEEDVGLDAAWRITSDLTLNATVNPDFSQVEADAPQLDVNNRFTLF